MNEETVIFGIRDKADLPKNFTGTVVYTSGDKEWLRGGKLHREDGPAREYHDGYKEWWLNAQGIYTNYYELFYNEGNFIVMERGIPTNEMFGKLKLTQAKLLLPQGIVFVIDNIPGLEIRE